MFNAPLLLLKEKEVEDEVKKLNKETTVQVSDTTMMTKDPEAGTQEKIIS
jgi:hypothetical protein